MKYKNTYWAPKWEPIYNFQEALQECFNVCNDNDGKIKMLIKLFSNICNKILTNEEKLKMLHEYDPYYEEIKENE